MASEVSFRPRIAVVDYDPAWPAHFETLRPTIWSAVGAVAIAIEHVGSTSVPGLAAKPIIDIDVVVATAADVPVAVERLATLGYEHRGNLGVDGREAFNGPPGPPRHHLYVCVQGGAALVNHLMLRSFLRQNSESAAHYGRLKKQLAAKFPTDIDRYVDGKTGFILAALREMGLSDGQLADVYAVNKLKD